MNPPHFLDTNVLLYSISRDPLEAAKREQAVRLLEDDNGAVSVQVLQEFYVQATRTSRPDPIPHDIAVALIATWVRFRVQEITLPLLTAPWKSRRRPAFPIGTARSSRRPGRLVASHSIPKT